MVQYTWLIFAFFGLKIPLILLGIFIYKMLKAVDAEWEDGGYGWEGDDSGGGGGGGRRLRGGRGRGSPSPRPAEARQRARAAAPAEAAQAPDDRLAAAPRGR